jgi:hypothetical protein
MATLHVVSITNGHLKWYRDGDVMGDNFKFNSSEGDVTDYIEILTEEALIRLEFVPVDPTLTAAASVYADAHDVSPIVDKCMSGKFCLETLKGTAGYTIRSANEMQLKCLEHNDIADIELQEACNKWIDCLEKKSNESTNSLHDLLRASLSKPVGSPQSLLLSSDTSSDSTEPGCFNPAIADPEQLECDCLEQIQEACKGHSNKAQCMNTEMCKKPMICKVWKDAHCAPSLITSTLSDLQQRASYDTSNLLTLESTLQSKCA